MLRIHHCSRSLRSFGLILCILGPPEDALRSGEGPPEEPAGPEAPALATRITGVTLYSDQALVVRTGATELPAGRSRWEVGGLPAGLVNEAVRARILDGPGVRLATIEVRERKRTVFRKKEAEEAEKTLKEIQARQRAVEESLTVLERETAVLKGLDVGRLPEGRPEKPVPLPIEPAAWKATLEFIDHALAENRKRAGELALELDGIGEELAVAQAASQRLASRKVRSEKAVILEVEAAAALKASLELAYQVPGPGWWPRYDLRADVEAKRITIVSYAIVRQETGEDWEGVDLTFSAAEPARAADLPELLAVHIGEAPAQVQAQVAMEDFSTVSTGAQATAASKETTLRMKVSNLESLNKDLLAKLQNVQGIDRAALSEGVSQGGQQAGAGSFGYGKAAQTKEILDRLGEQQAANLQVAEKGDWARFIGGNQLVIEGIQCLEARHRVYFAEDLEEARSNIARGLRRLKSARLGEGLVPPLVSSRGYDFRYRALRPETIPSDGSLDKVVIGVEELPAEFIYEAAPEARELSFLASRVRNQRRQPYLEGPASVFLGPDFVGDGKVPTTARGEEVPVELGADESVAVRRKVDTKRETTGVFTSWHRYRLEVEVTVKNQKARPVKAAVLERIPFSEDPKLTVERGEITPPPAREDRKGLLRFDLDLKPGEVRKIAYSYTIELPADRAVNGFNDPSVSW